MKKIVVIGGGVAGLFLATRLGKKLGKTEQAKITLIDQNSHHFWKPMLHEVATGLRNAYIEGVDFRTQGKFNNFKFRQGALQSIDTEKKIVFVSELRDEKDDIVFPASQHEYDILVMAIGSITNDFGTPGVKENCLFLNDYLDASNFRRKILTKLYQFSADLDNPEQKQIRISIVGGGATGVELSAEILKMAEKLKTYGVAKMEPEHLKVTLLEAGDRLLPALPAQLSQNIRDSLEKIGVNVITNCLITHTDEKGFYTKNGELIDSDIMAWTAGVKAPDILKNIGQLTTGKGNQIIVKPTLQSIDDDCIFAVGDCALYLNAENKPVAPPTAQAADQMAKLCYRNILAYLNRQPLQDFQYKDRGSVVTLAYTAHGIVSTFKTSKPIMIKGMPAYTMHYLLYHLHQAELYGLFRSLRIGLASSWIRKVKSYLDLPASRK